MRATMVAAALLATAVAQQGTAQTPEGWKVRPDRAVADTVAFESMAPGWHVTTGPAVILFRPDSTAKGNYRIESEIFLFDPGSRNEAFGILFGGSDLDGDGQTYGYFVIRRSGDFLVKRRDGPTTKVVRDWTPSSAIVKWPDQLAEGQATVKNIVVVDVGPRDVTFSVNGTAVATVPRAELPTDGNVGLRVNHALNLHVSKLAVTRL